jgi:DNA (cytosine-5)-methyltransferase 1
MTRPRLLDLFCGAGGAAMGYHRAGFDVVGVDVKPQPRYPFEFHQADAMAYPLGGFDAYHGSPPCQDHMRSPMPGQQPHGTGWMLAATRERFQATGRPWVIENVPGAPMAPLVLMCGSAFGLGTPGYQLRRHRWFETAGFWPMSPPCQHSGPVIGIYGDHGRDRRRTEGYGRYFTLAERQRAMDIDWMARGELDQAIPPAYTEYIGLALLQALDIDQRGDVELVVSERGT